VKDVTKSVKDAKNILVSFPLKISSFIDLVICVFIVSIDVLCFFSCRLFMNLLPLILPFSC